MEKNGGRWGDDDISRCRGGILPRRGGRGAAGRGSLLMRILEHDGERRDETLRKKGHRPCVTWKPAVLRANDYVDKFGLETESRCVEPAYARGGDQLR